MKIIYVDSPLLEFELEIPPTDAANGTKDAHPVG